MNTIAKELPPVSLRGKPGGSVGRVPACMIRVEVSGTLPEIFRNLVGLADWTKAHIATQINGVAVWAFPGDDVASLAEAYDNRVKSLAAVAPYKSKAAAGYAEIPADVAANQVREAVKHLNGALDVAHRAGLTVRLDYVERSDVGIKGEVRMYSVSVSREV